MEQPQKRDINELLTNGYFTTSRAKSPSGAKFSTSSSSLREVTPEPAPRADPSRSQHREPRGRRPPRPTVEDERVSLAREYRPAKIDDEPPLRGILEQNPIILEANVTPAEAARLHATPCPKDKDGNTERRFVLVPQDEPYYSSTSGDERPSRRQNGGSRSRGPSSAHLPPPPPRGENLAPRPQAERRRSGSRQDLPPLQTKVPRDLPPQFRRSASSYLAHPVDPTVKPPQRAPSDYHLSPDVQRPAAKDYFGASPRSSTESVGSSLPYRNGTGHISRPGTPLSEKRASGSHEKTRSRRNTPEMLNRPQQMSDEEMRRERHNSARLSTGSDRQRNGRSSPHSNNRYYSESESDIADSDSDRGHRRHRRHRELQVDEGRRRSHSRSNRNSAEIKPQKHVSSPLPSPKVSPNRSGRERERAETFPQRSGSRSPIDSRPVSPFSPTDQPSRPADRLNPLDAAPQTRSKSRMRPAHSISTPTSSTPTTILPPPPPKPGPNPVPTLVHNGSSLTPDGRRPAAAFPQYDENRAHSARPADPKQPWQPPAFQPNGLDKPMGTYRRHSEDVDKGSIAPLPTCPRMNFVRGRNDWLTLPQCPSFDICPSCFSSTIAPTEFRDFFIRAPSRSPDSEILCDFGSSPWYRIAWLLTLKERRRDLSLFYGLANVAATIPPCTGKREAIRQWHSMIDPKSRAPIQNFHVCHSCVRSTEVLLPPIRGVFVKMNSKSPMGDPRICDLRFDSKRFIQYFDALETTADKALPSCAPDTRPLASLCKRLSLFPECPRDRDLTNAPWHIITQLPEFTVCTECFDEVVWPEVEEGKAIPEMFNKQLQRVPKASCQLYSKKMRGIFRTAVDGDDYRLLASKARERKGVELAMKNNLEGLRRVPGSNAEREIERVLEEWRRWE